MRAHVLAAAAGLVAVGVTTGIVSGAGASGPTQLGAGEVATVVHLLRHDQQGVAIADQGAAESTTRAVQTLARRVGTTHQHAADSLAALLNAHHVPVRVRFGVPDGSTLPLPAGTVSPCDLASDDALGRLANTPADGFDAAFVALLRRHVSGGALLAGRLDAHAFTARERQVLRRAQRDVAALTSLSR